MEKKRVPKGKKYCYINALGEVQFDVDCYFAVDDYRYKCGNYFSSEKKAESMARKIKAVFDGADVIETPSEEEIIIKVNDAVVGRGLALVDENTAFKTIYSVVTWLKSKIVKQ